MSEDVMDEEDADVQDQLSQVVDLAQDMLDHQAKCEALEEQLKLEKEKFNHINQIVLPELMASIGMSEFKLENGIKLKVEDVISAKIPEDRENEAFAWLEETGNAGMVKSQISLAFAKDQQKKEEEVLKALGECDVSFSRKRGIHFQTLKAFVKGQLEAGEPLDQELFGVFIGKKITVKV